MDEADDLELRWLYLDPSQAGAGSLPGSPAGAGRGAGMGPAPVTGAGPGTAGAGPGTAAAGPGPAAAPEPGPWRETAERLDRHDLSNAVTAIAGAARLLCDRWDELGEAERKELAAMVLRRAEELRRALEVAAAAGAAGGLGTSAGDS